ncbi:hypothetical protein GRF61_21825 [Azoarcus sp. TTM-91]|uniref:hypothetical protein n=1 Tax=Azoarcus sp. TTM-91 TaxID=2691581 RepID=UPI00145F1FBF|nr:hypothetical protein [Azoarcus sp. TTM-91]NMG37100.1 hypothetical protein [Azoarcus sp. TTM-91]
MTSSVSIVFHSGHGHTAKVAQAVAEGCDATLLAIDAWLPATRRLGATDRGARHRVRLAGDLDTARLFGRRIADVVRRMN